MLDQQIICSCFKKTKHAKFSEIFLSKHAKIFWNSHFQIRPFALLPTCCCIDFCWVGTNSAYESNVFCHPWKWNCLENLRCCYGKFFQCQPSVMGTNWNKTWTENGFVLIWFFLTRIVTSMPALIYCFWKETAAFPVDS